MTKQAEVKDDPNYVPLLDHGFVGIAYEDDGTPAVMGNDQSIVRAARVSYGKGTKSVSDDRGLIRYLLRNQHSTPFEMVSFKFHCKMPIFVARQFIRHRTASVNEYSGRYSEMPDEFYIPSPEDISPQSNSNKQGREGLISENDVKSVLDIIENASQFAYSDYQTLLGNNVEYSLSRDYDGISRELARMVLPLNNYTEWYWKINLRNLFHFLKLRMDSHAQKEIRVYADAMYDLIKPYVPLACEAFNDYILKSETFSRMEMDVLRDAIGDFLCDHNKDLEEWIDNSGMSKREKDEFNKKIKGE